MGCYQHNKNYNTKRPLKILFIGNSLTNFNGGLDYMLKKMFKQSNPQMMIYSEKIAPGGERLSNHFKKGFALKKIKETDWDIVVLQEYSNGPIINREEFFKYSKLFVKEIRKNGSNAVFYMTFGYKNNLEMTPIVSKSYMAVAKELGCRVIPIGVVWQRVLNERNDMEMYKDFKHPSPNGTYLTACMFYSYLTGQNASNSNYINDLDAGDAAYLQNIAWRTVVEWKLANDK